MKLTEITDTNPDLPIAYFIIDKALKDGKKVTFESPVEVVARGKDSTRARHQIMLGDVTGLRIATARKTNREFVEMYYNETTEGYADSKAVTEVSNDELEDCDITVTDGVMHIKLPNYSDK